MTIRDVGYRRYEGTRHPLGERWLVVLRQSLATMRRQPWVLAMLILSAFPALVAAVVLFFKLRLGDTFGLGGEDAAARLIYSFQVGWYGTPILAFVVALFAGGGAISDDIRTRAFQFYFARPLSREQYLLGKLLAVLTLVFVVTAGPPLLLVLVRFALAGDARDVARQAILLGQVLGLASLEALLLAVPAVALSSLSPRRGLAQGAFAALFFLPWILGAILEKILRSPWPMILSIPSQLASLGANLFALDLGRQALLPWPAAFLAMTLLLGGALALLRWRLASMEVVAG